MTGPAYPRSAILAPPPAVPIPTPFDVWQTIISQYANSPILTTLLTNFGEYIDPTTNIDAFYDLIMNVDTAVGYGLDVWGRIVGVSRVIPVSGLGTYLGFQEMGAPTAVGFNQAPFYSGGTLTDNVALADSAFRVLILAKALANICDGSVKAINQLLLNLFPARGNCYVQDNLDMTMVYVFSFALTTVELAIVQNSGVLPKPTGVSYTVSVPP